MEEIIIAEEMAVNITDWPFLIIILGVGVTIGMYISSQIECHIKKRIENEQKKRKN